LLAEVRSNFNDAIRSLEKNGSLEAWLDDIQQSKISLHNAGEVIVHRLTRRSGEEQEQ
jgi:hypothetical protein